MAFENDKICSMLNWDCADGGAIDILRFDVFD